MRRWDEVVVAAPGDMASNDIQATLPDKLQHALNQLSALDPVEIQELVCSSGLTLLDRFFEVTSEPSTAHDVEQRTGLETPAAGATQAPPTSGS